MNLFELFVKIGVDDQASNKIQDISNKLGSGLMTAAKVGTTAAIAGLTAFTTTAAKSYAEYEQLVGGVETLYGAKYKTIEEYIEGTGAAAEYAEQTFAEYQKRQQAVLDNAANAYKTAGMSANEYMNTVNGFAASLTSSLGEYEWQAASYADMIVTDIADNANKMGTNMEMIQNAYAGFAKQNYTMLDNLKLGYGGTKTEMERLLADAEKISGMEFDISSFADVTEAIHIIQENMGIAGTTATEAEETIQGSLLAAKAAFMNFTVGIADENANVEELLNQLVESVVIAGGNIVPRVGEILGNIGTLLIENAPIMLKQGINQLTNFLLGLDSKAPDIISYVGQLVVNMGGALLRSAPKLLGAAGNLMLQLLAEIGKEAVNVGENLVKGFWRGIQNLASWLWNKVTGFFNGIVDGVKNALDIHSPSGESEWMAEMFAKGFGIGWDKNFPAVKKGIISDLDFGTASVNATANYDGNNGKFGGNGVIGKTVNVIQNIYSEAKTAADLMEEAIYNQERAVLLGV